MLWINSQFTGASAINSEKGNTNNFLTNVLIEAVVENYRQLMHEMVMLSASSKQESFSYDPPLRANERIMSGVIGNAIAKVASRSRCEARIDKEEIILNREDQNKEYEDLDTVNESKNRAGRVDYMAWYDNRTYAIELKMASMNCENPVPTTLLQSRWERVNDQARIAQDYLRNLNNKDKLRYPSPVSMALMVVVGRRKLSKKNLKDLNERVGELNEDFITALGGLKPKPQFQASYIFPQEFRNLLVRKRGAALSESEGTVYTPFIGFMARAYVNKTKS